MMQKEKLIDRIIKLHDLYKKGLIKTLAEHEVHPGLDPKSRENYLYFTLPPCINFQRSSPAMWQSALKTWKDPKTRYLFYPEKVIKKSSKDVQNDLLKYGLGIQKNKHTEIWTRISKTLSEHFGNDPRNILKAGDWDAEKILEILQREQKARFPYLSGPKMANYWLYILTRFTDAKFTNLHCISIIPDTHVIQCSARLGVTTRMVSPESVAYAWKEILAGTGINPIDMHPVLWNWSRNNFLPEV